MYQLYESGSDFLKAYEISVAIFHDVENAFLTVFQVVIFKPDIVGEY